MTEPASTAIARLFDQHGGKIYRLGVHVCGGPDDAQDLVQETFLRAFRKWHQFEGRSDPGTWLYTIASRLCRRMHRPRAGEPRSMTSLQALLPTGEPALPDIPGPNAGPFDDTLKKEARELVETAISTLPPTFRLPFLLKELADFSIAEISAILGLKEATVKTRVHRGRLQVRKVLAGGLPTRVFEDTDHSIGICLDLLQTKQEALDKGVPFPLPPSELCTRCQSFFATLDLVQNACAEIARDGIPDEVRSALKKRLSTGHADD